MEFPPRANAWQNLSATFLVHRFLRCKRNTPSRIARWLCTCTRHSPGLLPRIRSDAESTELTARLCAIVLSRASVISIYFQHCQNEFSPAETLCTVSCSCTEHSHCLCLTLKS